MRIYTEGGDLKYQVSTFPDHQPHFKLERPRDFHRNVWIETAIRTPTELFQVVLATQVLHQQRFNDVYLDVRYLMGARMDRAIDAQQPLTLSVVARILNGSGFSKVRILDVHSPTATELLWGSTNVLPHAIINRLRRQLNDPVIISPDKGAVARVTALAGNDIVYCEKTRDRYTGKLSGFTIKNPSAVRGRECLIIDDICDGGGTFVGLAKELRAAGATDVSLYVTHGIFSKGLPLENISQIFTTDSYFDTTNALRTWTFVPNREKQLCVLPISMKDLR